MHIDEISGYDDNRIRYLNVTITFESVFTFTYIIIRFSIFQITKNILINFSIIEFLLVKFKEYYTFIHQLLINRFGITLLYI